MRDYGLRVDVEALSDHDRLDLLDTRQQDFLPPSHNRSEVEM